MKFVLMNAACGIFLSYQTQGVEGSGVLIE